MGDLPPNFAPSFRKDGHSHIENVYSADCLMFNWYHTEMSSFEHQTAGTRRRRANINL